MKRFGFTLLLIIFLLACVSAEPTSGESDSNPPVTMRANLKTSIADYVEVGFSNTEVKSWNDAHQPIDGIVLQFAPFDFDSSSSTYKAEARVYLYWRILTKKSVAISIQPGVLRKNEDTSKTVSYNIARTPGSDISVTPTTDNNTFSMYSKSGSAELRREADSILMDFTTDNVYNNGVAIGKYKATFRVVVKVDGKTV